MKILLWLGAAVVAIIGWGRFAALKASGAFADATGFGDQLRITVNSFFGAAPAPASSGGPAVPVVATTGGTVGPGGTDDYAFVPSTPDRSGGNTTFTDAPAYLWPEEQIIGQDPIDPHQPPPFVPWDGN